MASDNVSISMFWAFVFSLMYRDATYRGALRFESCALFSKFSLNIILDLKPFTMIPKNWTTEVIPRQAVIVQIHPNRVVQNHPLKRRSLSGITTIAFIAACIVHLRYARVIAKIQIAMQSTAWKTYTKSTKT